MARDGRALLFLLSVKCSEKKGLIAGQRGRWARPSQPESPPGPSSRCLGRRARRCERGRGSCGTPGLRRFGFAGGSPLAPGKSAARARVPFVLSLAADFAPCCCFLFPSLVFDSAFSTPAAMSSLPAGFLVTPPPTLLGSAPLALRSTLGPIPARGWTSGAPGRWRAEIWLGVPRARPFTALGLSFLIWKAILGFNNRRGQRQLSRCAHQTDIWTAVSVFVTCKIDE